MIQRFLSLLIYGLTSAIGMVAFLYPFWQPVVSTSLAINRAHANDATLVLTVLVLLCFAVLLLEVQSQAVNTKTVALLGMLVAINATLRVIDNIVPIPGGFSPIFLLIVLTGYVYGGRLGFLMGTLTMLVSALLTGAVGPWLPYQMFTAGWVGMTAPICGVARPEGSRKWRVWGGGWRIPGDSTGGAQGYHAWVEVVVLALFSGLWGLLFGALMNIWFWPFAAGDPAQYWQPGITLTETVRRYAFFYVATSLVWDTFRLVGNVVLMLVLGRPFLRVLRRFHARFDFHYQPLIAEATVGAPATGEPI